MSGVAFHLAKFANHAHVAGRVNKSWVAVGSLEIQPAWRESVRAMPLFQSV